MQSQDKYWFLTYTVKIVQAQCLTLGNTFSSVPIVSSVSVKKPTKTFLKTLSVCFQTSFFTFTY